MPTLRQGRSCERFIKTRLSNDSAATHICIIVSLQATSRGALPPAWIIDELMHCEGRSHYARYLKATE